MNVPGKINPQFVWLMYVQRYGTDSMQAEGTERGLLLHTGIAGDQPTK